jgi:putative holliday junction resolvase
MARLLALDYGTKRVGVAVTDPSQLIASPLTTVAAGELLTWLRQYVAAEPVAALVVGLPRHLDGGPTDTTPHVVGLVRTLRKAFPDLPVHTVDERFTTTMAHQTMRAGGLGRKARQDKATVDKISAAIILQSFMESRANEARRAATPPSA